MIIKRLPPSLYLWLAPRGVHLLAFLIVMACVFASSYLTSRNHVEPTKVIVEVAERHPHSQAAQISEVAILAAMLKQFPDVQTAPKDYAFISRSANQFKVPLDKLAWNWSDVSGLPLKRVDFSLEARLSRSDLQAFVQTLKHGMPHLSVEQISFKRDGAMTEVLQSQLQLALFYRATAE